MATMPLPILVRDSLLGEKPKETEVNKIWLRGQIGEGSRTQAGTEPAPAWGEESEEGPHPSALWAVLQLRSPSLLSLSFPSCDMGIQDCLFHNLEQNFLP